MTAKYLDGVEHLRTAGSQRIFASQRSRICSSAFSALGTKCARQSRGTWWVSWATRGECPPQRRCTARIRHCRCITDAQISFYLPSMTRDLRAIVPWSRHRTGWRKGRRLPPTPPCRSTSGLPAPCYRIKVPPAIYSSVCAKSSPSPQCWGVRRSGRHRVGAASASRGSRAFAPTWSRGRSQSRATTVTSLTGVSHVVRPPALRRHPPGSLRVSISTHGSRARHRTFIEVAKAPSRRAFTRLFSPSTNARIS
jgi:hypothetical protein